MTSKTDSFEAALMQVRTTSSDRHAFRDGARWAAKWMKNNDAWAWEMVMGARKEVRSQTLADVRKAWEEAQKEGAAIVAKHYPNGNAPISQAFIESCYAFERKLQALRAKKE